MNEVTDDEQPCTLRGHRQGSGEALAENRMVVYLHVAGWPAKDELVVLGPTNLRTDIMSDTDESNQHPASVTRLEALRTTAKLAGAVAFLSPVVVGAFSGAAFASSAACDGYSTTDANCNATDSDAVTITAAANREWNQNCGGSSVYGRYNAQRSEFTVGSIVVTLTFGATNTDNFPVTEGWYTATGTGGGTNYSCTAYWKMKLASWTSAKGVDADPGCTDTATQCSVVPLGAPSGAKAVPYCTAVKQGNPECPAGVKLVLMKLVCCPI